MKSKKPSAKQEPPPAAKPNAASPRRRQWFFRLFALALPLFLFLALELILRLFGYGYPVGFFLKGEVNGQAARIDNQQFSRRYFPPGLARSPQPALFPAVKVPGTMRIFILGESAAMGDPEPSFGFGRVLETMLRERWPGKKIEVINTAVTAINSHVIREIARDCAGEQGDYWLVYMGNNEVVGPYGAGTIFGGQTPSLALIRASLALKATRVGQLLDAAGHRLLRKAGTPKTWEGMEMFLKQQVALDDPRMAKVYQHFEQNLGEILELGKKSGARVLVSTVISNLKDSPPFASRHRAGLTPERAAEWERLFRAGIAREQAREYAAALAQYEPAGKIDDDFAELRFRMGRCHLALGRAEDARRNFEWARDLDTLRFRADTRINQIIRHVAARTAGVQPLDAVERFTQKSPNGLAGEEFLYEHVHFKFDGNYELARLFAEAILGGDTNAPPLLAAADCARRLALTDFDRRQVADEMLKRLQQPPFATQLDAAAREQRWRTQLDSLRATPDGINRDIARYRESIARAPDDWVLRENFAKLLQNSGEPKEAEEQWRAVRRLLPHSEQACYSLANVLDAQGKSAEAVTLFREALKRRPGSIEARNGLGLALASQGQTAEAVEQFEQ